jgi:hypothetical protein
MSAKFHQEFVKAKTQLFLIKNAAFSREISNKKLYMIYLDYTMEILHINIIIYDTFLDSESFLGLTCFSLLKTRIIYNLYDLIENSFFETIYTTN